MTPVKKKDDDFLKRSEEWVEVATIVGLNELAKMHKTLGEKMYFRLLREEMERRRVEQGRKRVIQETPENDRLVINAPQHTFLTFQKKDIELMREAVKEYDRKAAKAKTKRKARP